MASRYTTLTTVQLLIMTILMGAIAGGLSISFIMYHEYTLLPIVHKSVTGECVKVLNLENGHAFSCPDVDVLLRQYRTVIEKPEKQ